MAPLIRAAAFAMAIAACTSQATEAQFAKAEVYYYGWNVTTRGRLSLDAVRARPRIKTEVYSPMEVREIVLFLQLDQMKSSSAAARITGDPRLVLDFWDAEGRRTTYYSDGIRLIAEDGSRSRMVTAAFRQRFTFGRQE